MGTMISHFIKYEYGLDEIKKLLAKELSVVPERVEVEYVISEVGADRMDRGGWPAVTAVRVQVDNRPIELLPKRSK
jgi:hypothetical protein